jgi:NADH-quinone oxidoreductase subunit N
LSSITLESVLALAPELCLLILAIVILFINKAFKRDNQRGLGLTTAWGSFLILLITLGIWFFLDQPSAQPELYWGGMIRQDLVTLVFRVIFLIALLVTSLISLDFKGVQRSEYYALLLTATIGFSLMSASADLIMLYIALETASISLYALAAFKKKESRSDEAGMKYFIYGAFASAVMLFGMSYLYGLTQETNIYVIAETVARSTIGNPTMQATVLVSAALVIVGFGFKISAVPYHFWAPDVYEGAPTPVTGLVSTASKAAGFAVFLRVFTAGVFGPANSSNAWWAMLVAICIVTMFLGNLLAIRQTNIKRMLAYSSIAQAGYAMMGLIAAMTTMGVNTDSIDGAGATMYFLLYYMISNVAAFAVVIIVSNINRSDEIKDLSGLSRRSPYLALAMLLALLSLGGIPPTAGFFGKFFIFRATVEAGLWWLALLGIINAFIALYYYLSVAKVMYLYRSDDEQVAIPVSRASGLAIGLTIFGILYLGILANSTFELTRRAATAFFAG